MHRPATCCVCSLTHVTSTFRRGVHAGLRDAQALRGFRVASKQRRDQQGSTARSSDREILRRTFRRQCQIGAVHAAGGRPRIKPGAVIINISSLNSRYPSGHLYSATKAALESHTISLSRELGPRHSGRRCGTWHGGYANAPGQQQTRGAKRHDRTQNPASDREGDDVAAVVAFLATHDAGFLTDETVHINGGQRL